MKKIRIYLDTSVIGGCFDKEFEKYSNKLFDEILEGIKIGVVSELTIRELEKAPILVKEKFITFLHKLETVYINSEVEDLALAYLKANIVTEKYFEDAVHIALATVYNLDILVSWNFKHIVNYNKIRAFNSENIKLGYKSIEIYSPLEVIGNE